MSVQLCGSTHQVSTVLLREQTWKFVSRIGCCANTEIQGLYVVLALTSEDPHTVKSCLPRIYPWCHTRDKMCQALPLLSGDSLGMKLRPINPHLEKSMEHWTWITALPCWTIELRSQMVVGFTAIQSIHLDKCFSNGWWFYVAPNHTYMHSVQTAQQDWELWWGNNRMDRRWKSRMEGPTICWQVLLWRSSGRELLPCSLGWICTSAGQGAKYSILNIQIMKLVTAFKFLDVFKCVI